MAADPNQTMLEQSIVARRSFVRSFRRRYTMTVALLWAVFVVGTLFGLFVGWDGYAMVGVVLGVLGTMCYRQVRYQRWLLLHGGPRVVSVVWSQSARRPVVSQFASLRFELAGTFQALTAGGEPLSEPFWAWKQPITGTVAVVYQNSRFVAFCTLTAGGQLLITTSYWLPPIANAKVVLERREVITRLCAEHDRQREAIRELGVVEAQIGDDPVALLNELWRRRVAYRVGHSPWQLAKELVRANLCGLAARLGVRRMSRSVYGSISSEPSGIGVDNPPVDWEQLL